MQISSVGSYLSQVSSEQWNLEEERQPWNVPLDSNTLSNPLPYLHLYYLFKVDWKYSKY